MLRLSKLVSILVDCKMNGSICRGPRIQLGLKLVVLATQGVKWVIKFSVRMNRGQKVCVCVTLPELRWAYNKSLSSLYLQRIVADTLANRVCAYFDYKHVMRRTKSQHA